MFPTLSEPQKYKVKVITEGIKVGIGTFSDGLKQENRDLDSGWSKSPYMNESMNISKVEKPEILSSRMYYSASKKNSTTSVLDASGMDDSKQGKFSGVKFVEGKKEERDKKGEGLTRFKLIDCNKCILF